MPASSLTDIDLDAVLDDLIRYQRRRVTERAHRLNPKLTDDDLLNPHDFAELASSAEWNYEDGLLAGYLAAQAAIRARFRRDTAP